MTAGPLPVGVLTGFLGVGKTTLLNRLLHDPALARTAVIVNEFGEVGIDHLLVEAVSGDMLVLTTGCVCCAARGDLLAALDGLVERRDALGIDRILIETTGLADPGPVLNAILLGPGVTGAVRPGGVLTLVSAVNGVATLDRHDEARRQVALADRVLITKTDLVPAGDAETLRDRLAAINPVAPIGDVRTVVIDAELFGSGARVSQRAAGRHHHHAADARIRAVVLEAGLVEAAHLGRFVAALQHRYGAALLRLKGIAALRHDPHRPTIVQAIGHLLHPSTHLDGWRGREPGTQIVAILDDGDAAAIAALWDGFFGGPAIDRPDAVAMMGEGGAGLFD